MTEGTTPTETSAFEGPASAAPGQLTPRGPAQPLRWRSLPGALLLGLVVGGGVGAGVVAAVSDPTRSEEYLALQEELSTAQDQASAFETQAQRAASDKRRVEAEVARRDSELDQRERTVGAREQAVSAVEQQIAANSIGQGTWTVGRDIEPGTYRTREAVVGDCYWAILASGTNGGDIIENDIPSGGFPTVTLSVGQDFENNRCGTFVKQ
jgi:hypothetical protein